MFKRRVGFTLIEVIIAISLLSFVLIMSSAIFDNIIKQNLSHRQGLTKNSQQLSLFDDSTLKAREYASYYADQAYGSKEIMMPNNYQEPQIYNIDGGFDFSGIKINSVKGYFVSLLDNKVEINKVSQGDSLVSFVGIGHVLSNTSLVSDMWVNSANSFIWYPLDVNRNILHFGYSIDDTSKNFSAMRTSAMVSKIYNQEDHILYTPYYKDNMKLGDYDNLKKDEEPKDNPSKYSDNEKLFDIKSYSDDEKSYLEFTDRSLVASGFTINANGRISSIKSTLDNIDDNKSFVHLVSLPYKKNLFGYYDYNLAIAKSTDGKKYYSLFDTTNKDNTQYGNKFIKDSDKYKFNFDTGTKNDVRDLLELDGDKTVLTELNNSDGFVPEKEYNKEDGSVGKIPYVKKSYGNTIYYSDKIFNITPKLGTKYTIFMKLNLENYNNEFNKKNELSPAVLLSNNVDLTSGNLAKLENDAGFVVYLEKDGKVKFKNYKCMKASGKLETKLVKDEEIYDLKNANLYTDDNNKLFDTLSYIDSAGTKKRDGRVGFNIIAITLEKTASGYNCTFNILQRDNYDDTKLATKIISKNLSIDAGKYANSMDFGAFAKADIADLGMTRAENDDAIELSDLLIYKEDLSVNSQGTRNKLSLVADYLYRKYLTTGERSNFDEYFITKY